MDEDDNMPYENTFSLEELRREVRRVWDEQNGLTKALRDLPEVPPPRVLMYLSRAARFPDDCNIGKGMQRQLGSDAIPYKVEYEMGAGLWSRIRAALNASSQPAPPPAQQDA